MGLRLPERLPGKQTMYSFGNSAKDRDRVACNSEDFGGKSQDAQRGWKFYFKTLHQENDVDLARH
jgi:hypothetical protein